MTTESLKTKFSRLLFLLLIIIFVGIFYFWNINPCRLPVRFKVGDYDQKFSISQSEMKEVAIESAQRWNTAFGRTVIEFDPNANLTVNLTYDERQAKRDELNSELSGLNLANTDIETVKARLNALVAQYQTDVKKYNDDVDYWNSQGGAPPSVYESLRRRKIDLDQRLVEKNKAIELLNNQIEKYNQDVKTTREKITQNTGKAEVEGLYQPSQKRIDIFTFGNKKELLVIMMHEMGHAIGADHTENPNSIMYYLIEKQNFDNPVPAKEDLDSSAKICNTYQKPLSIFSAFYYNISRRLGFYGR